jgi:2-polyprenyl-3-methyl-5-hydroxy-6-metoxy-1,4-benzoquinol methylase
METQAVLQEWEQAEIRRSAAEAESADVSSLLASAANMARYVNPPADTLFPLEYAFHLLGDVTGRVVLEYGSGWGENTIVLARRGAQVHALDISPELIEINRRRMQVNGVTSGVRFSVASAYDVPCPESSVDVVFGMAILHHLDLELAAREVYRVLRPGGRAIFSEPMRSSPTLRALRRMIPCRLPANVSPYERPLTLGELAEFSKGFLVGRSRSFELPWSRAAERIPLLRTSLMALRRWDRAMLARFPGLAYYAAVRVFEIRKP